MRVLAAVLAFGATSCIVEMRHKHANDDVSEPSIPAGCTEQLSFVRRSTLEKFRKYGTHVEYRYKSQHKCNASVTISHNHEMVADGAITFMDEKNIACDTDSDGRLLLKFPSSNDEKHQQVKFPCDTKEISIARVPTWDSTWDFVDRGQLEIEELVEKDKADRSNRWWDKFSHQIVRAVASSAIHGVRGMAHLAHGYATLFSDFYKTFREKVLGGLAIVYSNHQQAELLYGGTGLGIIGKTKRKYSYGALGVDKEGHLVYHILVDKKGKKQMLYPQE